MSDTPRTDARLGYENEHHGANMLCRELERELNQAIKERDDARRAFDDTDMCKLGQAPCAWAMQLIKERDENKAGWDRASLVALSLEQRLKRAVKCIEEIDAHHKAKHGESYSRSTLNTIITNWRDNEKAETA